MDRPPGPKNVVGIENVVERSPLVEVRLYLVDRGRRVQDIV